MTSVGAASSPPTFRVQYARWLLPLAIFISAAYAQDSRVLLKQGEVLWTQGDYTQALDTFRKVAESSSDQLTAAEAQFWMGKVCYYQWSLERAAAEFQQVVERYPHSEWAPVAQRWRGDCAYFGKDYSKALAEYQKVVDHHPGTSQSPLALFQSGQCHERMGNLQAARAVYNRLATDFGASPYASRARFELRRLEKPSEPPVR